MEKIPQPASESIIPAGHPGKLFERMSAIAVDGVVCISAPDLATLSGYSERSIWRYIRALQEARLLTVMDSGRGRGKRAKYRLENLPENLPIEPLNVPDRAPPLSNNSRSLRTKTPVLKASSNGKLIPNKASIGDKENVPIGPAGQELLSRIFREVRAGRKTWDMGRESAALWDEVVTTGGVRAGSRLIADIVNYLTEGAQSFDGEFWGRVGVTVRSFGKSALKGYLVALGKGLGDKGLHDYAYAVAKSSAEQVYAEHGNGRKDHLRVVEAT